jgi:hypothetical protein
MTRTFHPFSMIETPAGVNKTLYVWILYDLIEQILSKTSWIKVLMLQMVE